MISSEDVDLLMHPGEQILNSNSIALHILHQTFHNLPTSLRATTTHRRTTDTPRIPLCFYRVLVLQ